MCHGYMYAIGTYNHGEFFSNILAPKLIAEALKFMFIKRFVATSHHLPPKHYKVLVLQMCHGYMYAIRTYNHGEFFCNILFLVYV